MPLAKFSKSVSSLLSIQRLNTEHVDVIWAKVLMKCGTLKQTEVLRTLKSLRVCNRLEVDFSILL